MDIQILGTSSWSAIGGVSATLVAWLGGILRALQAVTRQVAFKANRSLRVRMLRGWCLLRALSPVFDGRVSICDLARKDFSWRCELASERVYGV